MLNRLNDKRGFTLIEIVLVLAIAALIMLIVFLAVGGAQRTRRDAARKNNAGRILSAMESYASNNNGTYATIALGPGYTTNITDPLTGAVPSYGSNSTATAATPMYYASGNICNATGGTTTAGAVSRNVAVSYWSEVAAAAACVDNR